MSRFWQCAGMTLLSALVSACFAIQGLFSAGSASSFAQYAGSRSIALLIGAVYACATRSRPYIAVLAMLMSLVQGFDGIVGLLAHDPAKTYGPFFFAALNVVALFRMQSEQKRIRS